MQGELRQGSYLGFLSDSRSDLLFATHPLQEHHSPASEAIFNSSHPSLQPLPIMAPLHLSISTREVLDVPTTMAEHTPLLPSPLFTSTAALASSLELDFDIDFDTNSPLSTQALYAQSFDRPGSSQSLSGRRMRKNMKEMTGCITTEEEFDALPIAVRRKVCVHAFPALLNFSSSPSVVGRESMLLGPARKVDVTHPSSVHSASVWCSPSLPPFLSHSLAASVLLLPDDVRACLCHDLVSPRISRQRARSLRGHNWPEAGKGSPSARAQAAHTHRAVHASCRPCRSQASGGEVWPLAGSTGCSRT